MMYTTVSINVFLKLCIGTFQDPKVLWVHMQNIFQTILHQEPFVFTGQYAGSIIGLMTFKHTLKSTMLKPTRQAIRI